MKKGDIVIIKNTLVLAEGLRGKRALIRNEQKLGLTFVVEVLEGNYKGEIFYLGKQYLQQEQWSVS